MALVKTVFSGVPTKLDYADIPSAVFSQPPIGNVGLTEPQARERCGAVDIIDPSFAP